MKKVFLYLLIITSAISCSKNEDSNMSSSNSCITDQATNQKIVLLVLGQSNAANYGKELFSSNCNKTYNFYQGKLYPLKDPLKGASGEKGSVWSRLGNLLIENNFAEEIIIAPASVGGTAIEQWIPGGDLNYLITETVHALQASNHEITHILWHQGESNHSATNPNISTTQNALDYKNNFNILVNYLRDLNVNSPIFIAQATRCGSRSIDIDLQNAQFQLANDSLKIYNGPNTDLLGNEYRYDNCHFNAKGLNEHAQLWADILIEF